jgi:protein-tyrosine phosphatase
MSWQPNFNWITDGLAVGGSFPSDRADSLAREHRINAVVDLRNEGRDDEHLLRRHGITLLHLPTEDMCGVDEHHLESGIRFSCEQLDRGARVLIHCEHGIGRSAVLALCVIVRRGLAPLDALELMKSRRSLVSPSPTQFECWTRWLEQHRRDQAMPWAVPSFDEFKAIAYRHLAPSA